MISWTILFSPTLPVPASAKVAQVISPGLSFRLKAVSISEISLFVAFLPITATLPAGSPIERIGLSVGASTSFWFHHFQLRERTLFFPMVDETKS